MRRRLRLLSVDPEVPQLARDLRRRDAVGVVRDEAQQEDAVVPQVEVGEPAQVGVRRPPVHRVHAAVVDAVDRATAGEADSASEVVAHEANAVLRN